MTHSGIRIDQSRMASEETAMKKGAAHVAVEGLEGAQEVLDLAEAEKMMRRFKN